MNKKVQFSCDVEFVSTFANEDYGKFYIGHVREKQDSNIRIPQIELLKK